jgi:hypothetical protein
MMTGRKRVQGSLGAHVPGLPGTLQVPRPTLNLLAPTCAHMRPLALLRACLVTGRPSFQPRFVRLAPTDQRTQQNIGKDELDASPLYLRVLLEA